MKTRISEELISISARLMLATERSEIIRAASQINETVEKLLEKEKNGSYIAYKPQVKSVSGTLKFTHKEISSSNMAKTFKKEFIANGLSARIIKRESGKNSFCYEIRYRRNGYDIESSSTDLDEAKKKFLQKTTPENIEKYKINIKKHNKENAFISVFEEWYDYKNGSVTEKEHRRFLVNFSTLPKTLQNKPITDIRTGDLDEILKSVKPRKYEELRTLFNGIFRYAVASGIVTHNPVSLIRFVRAERISRDSLTDDEIFAFLNRINLPKFEPIRQGVYLLYFFGLRPCEVDQETRRENDFLIARNRKRKNGKIEYKKIPIPKQAQRLIDWDKPLIFNCSNWKRDKLFKELLGDNERTAYCLRHTFSTICQQYLKRPDIVDIWMGDSSERLVGRVYTHFPDKFMKEQMESVVFPVL